MIDMSHVVSTGWLAWAPLAAAVLHVFEEFVVPGGFMQWYCRYRGSSATVTKGFLWKINALLLAGCINAGFAGVNPGDVWFWVFVVAILGANGAWHAYASLRSRSYSPGTITGVVIYLPLALLSIGHFALAHELRPVAWIAAGVGALYPMWSALFHALSTSVVPGGR